MKNFLSNAIDGISDTAKSVTDKYDTHICTKAMEIVDEKLQAKNLKVEDIEATDYESMISDASKDIRADYNKKAAQAGLAILGLDLLFGV